MKLSLKIFFSMCITVVVSLIFVLGIISDKTFETAVKKENERTVAEFSDVSENIQRSFLEYGNSLPSYLILEKYNNYYSDNNLKFIYLHNDEIKDSFIPEVNKYISDEILNVGYNEVKSKIIQNNQKHYLLVAATFGNDYSRERIIGVRDISYIYENQQEIKEFGLIMILVIATGVGIISLIISHTLTAKLKEMVKVTERISKGDYKISLKEDKSEIGMLSKSFNKMAIEIESRTNELIELADSKQTFIDNLSHEMNTPLTTIQGYAEYLERANVPPENQVKYLQYIKVESKRIRDIYKKLLLLSYKKENDLEIIENSFPEILTEVNVEVENRLNEKNIELIIKNEIDKLKCDKTLVQIAISNLIINAMNVSDINTKIILNCYKEDNMKIIEVIDYGIGISKENIKKILEPFYRVDKSRSRQHGGAGLGLSICNSIMKMHNGKIEIESEIGKGSKFRLIFQ